MNIKGRVDRLSDATTPRPPTRCAPYGPEWIERADALLWTMPNAQAEHILDDLLQGRDTRDARALTEAAARGVTFAEGLQL